MPPSLGIKDYMLPFMAPSLMKNLRNRFQLLDQFKPPAVRQPLSATKIPNVPMQVTRPQRQLRGQGIVGNGLPPLPEDPLDSLDELMQGGVPSEETIAGRIGGAKRNLGLSTLAGLLPSVFQSSGYNVPKQDDTFLDQMDQQIPQHITDAENASIDSNTRGVTDSILSRGGSLNAVSNLVNTVANRGVEAKSALAVGRRKENIGLRNDYLGRKQVSLDRFNANDATAQNAVRDSENTRISNIGALGTNYFNQVGELEQNQNALLDKAGVLKTNQAMQLYQMKLIKDLLSRKIGK